MSANTEVPSKKRAPLRVRRADDERDARRRALYAAFRIALYGMLGVSLEVGFYSLVRVGQMIPGVNALFLFDWQVDPALGLGHIKDVPLKVLYGQASLWMIPVYAGAAFGFVEPLYRRLCRSPVLVRALAYGLAITFWEVVSGWLAFWATGYRIWLYADALSIFGMSSWAITPIWCISGLVVELIYRELMDPRVRRALEAELDEMKAPPELAGAE